MKNNEWSKLQRYLYLYGTNNFWNYKLTSKLKPELKLINPLKTSPVYTWVWVYGKCVL